MSNNRYSAAAIEIHLSDLTQGMDTTGVDVDASNAKAAQLIEEAVAEAFAGYTVAVFSGQSQMYAIDVTGYPNELDEDEIKQVAEDALGEVGEGRWYVLVDETEDEDETRTLRALLTELDDGRFQLDDGAQNWTPANLLESLDETDAGRTELARRVNCMLDDAPEGAELPAHVGGISFLGDDGYQTSDGYRIIQVRR